MFHITHKPIRQWIIHRGVWHIDDSLLFLLLWIPKCSFKIPEIFTLPVWTTLKNIPNAATLIKNKPCCLRSWKTYSNP